MSTNVEIFYLCGAGFGLGVLALGLYFAYSSGRERERPGKDGRRTVMNEYLKAFWQGFMRGAKETPRQFFAPVIGIYRWLGRISDEVVQEKSTRR